MQDLAGAQRMKLHLHCPESILVVKPLIFLNFSALDDSVRSEQMEQVMENNLFVINYKLHGVPKFFIIRSKSMQNADAWHWASCDAGVAPIPRPGRPPLKMVSKPQAEKYGITDVTWRASST